jgi:ABC-2 type transport system ATP-binding protein
MNSVSIQGVSKRFRLPDQRFNSLKERVLHFGKVPYHEFWALKDINLEISEGTTTGLLGRNGSGKSTLLKCIAGILQPTSGQIVVKGRLASMLELGSGFHPDLSGRDNVYLNGSLLGFSKKDIDKRFDSIVEFAELSEFIDSQVKHYSSGMYARLGFAVAVNVDPDILLVDEVLAVGDEAFQNKCMDRIKQFQREGRTIVLVTHGTDQVRQICDYAAVLSKGDLVYSGDSLESIRSYRDILVTDANDDSVHLEVAENEPEGEPLGVWDEKSNPKYGEDLLNVGVSKGSEFYKDRTIEILSVTFRDKLGVVCNSVMTAEPLIVEFEYKSCNIDEELFAVFSIYSVRGEIIFRNFFQDDLYSNIKLSQNGTIKFNIDQVPLLDGTFKVSLELLNRENQVIFQRDSLDSFSVTNPTKNVGLVNLQIKPSVE